MHLGYKSVAQSGSRSKKANSQYQEMDMNASFNMSRKDTERLFRAYVEEMRGMLRVAGRPFVVRDAGRLPPQEDHPNRFIDLVLRTADHAITLRVRIDNAYVIGFRNGVEEGTWFELTNTNNAGEEVNLIDDSSPLRFGGAYQPGGLGTLNENVQLGRSVVETAIEVLARHGNGSTVDDDSLKLWLRTLILHFIEPLRFNFVADRLVRLMAHPDDPQPSTSDPADMLLGRQAYHLVQNWGRLSTDLLADANEIVHDPEVMARRFRNFADAGIHNAFEAAAALGLVLLAHPTRRRQKRSVPDNEDHVVAGITLAEVTEVTITRIDDEEPGDLFGSIIVIDGIGSEQVFSRARSEFQSIKPGEQARLTGPNRAMSGADDFAVYLDLKDEDTDLSPDDEVSKGVVVWNPRIATSDEYDVIQSRTVYGASGNVELRFAVVTDAAVATIEVKVLESSESAPNIYGTITSTTRLEDGTPLSFKLLDSASDQSVETQKGSAIRLDRKAVAVPLCSVMEVGVSLWDRNIILSDGHIANGSVTFETPGITGENSAEVSGDDGRVEVRVVWSTWFD